MFEENIDVFFSDFAEPVTYSDTQTNLLFNAIIDKNIELIGQNGEVLELTTAFTIKSNSDIEIGGSIKTKNQQYTIDSIISDDGGVMVLSVV